MLRFVVRMVKFSGKYKRMLLLSFLLSFLEGILQSVPILCIWQAIDGVLNQTMNPDKVKMISFVLVGSLLVRMVLRYWFNALESGAGFEICERERLSLGEKLRHFPMGFFTEGNLGNVTSALSIDLPFIEEHGMDALDKVINGYVTSFIGTCMLFYVDVRIGLVTLCTFLVAIFLLRWIDKISKEQSKTRQYQQSKLVGAVLEYVQGIGVIKAFHMGEEKAQNVTEAIESTKEHSIGYEEALTIPYFIYKGWFSVGIALTITLSAYLISTGQLNTSMGIAVFIFIFSLYTPGIAFASLSAQVRVMEAGLNRYENVSKVEEMQEGRVKEVRNKREIEFKDVNFLIEEGSTTALVGSSGGGKTTIANLIVRFWDVQKGEVKFGGTNIKDLKTDTLLSQFSMVFQNVYLFSDTIENNIKFGNPKASKAQIREAAKKARCHEFIMELENGYDTVVGEGGSTLSGGEKQRISIARAMLKDAPIIILDEATASVDPDNEYDIQMALDELIKNKTLIMIAHRLSTIKNADQILVVEEKRIIERGTHEELLKREGRYKVLWDKRMKASSWEIAQQV